jgi:hypothetical protein
MVRRKKEEKGTIPLPSQKKEVSTLTSMRLTEKKGDNLLLHREEKGKEDPSLESKKEVKFLTSMKLKEEEGWTPPLYREEKTKSLLPNQKEEVRSKLTLVRLKEEKGDNLHFRPRRKLLRSLFPISEGRCLTQVRGNRKVRTALILLVPQ